MQAKSSSLRLFFSTLSDSRKPNTHVTIVAEQTGVVIKEMKWWCPSKLCVLPSEISVLPGTPAAFPSASVNERPLS